MSPLVEWAGWLVGVVVGPWGLWLTLRSRRRVALLYQINVTTLIGGKDVELPPDIVVTFQGRRLENARKVNLIVWNRGTQAVRRDDVQRLVTLSLPTEATILTAAVARQSVDENRVECLTTDLHPNSLQAEFAYLNVGQGFNIEVIFTGSAGPVTCDAVVIDMPDGLINVSLEDLKTDRLPVLPTLVAMAAALLMVSVPIGFIWLLSDFFHAHPWTVLLAAFFSPVSAIGFAFGLRRLEASSEPPRALLR